MIDNLIDYIGGPTCGGHLAFLAVRIGALALVMGGFWWLVSYKRPIVVTVVLAIAWFLMLVFWGAFISPFG